MARRALLLTLVAAAAEAQRDGDGASVADAREREAHARALGYVARADSLLRAGRVGAAESLYYATSRWRPRDPAPRVALGRYLAARGATHIGAVLIEEGRRFGASPALAALHLAPLYARMGAWEALRDLQASSLGAAERERAAWLASREAVEEGPDSLELALRPARAAGALGAVMLRVGGDSVVAEIDAETRGLVLDIARSAGVRRFTGDGAGPVVGVAERVTLGSLVLGDVPVSFASMGGAAHARVGLDFLARWAPTVRGERLVLRRGGRVEPELRGDRLALLLDPSVGALVARQGRLASPADLLRGRAWTLDPRRGELVLHAR